MDKVIVAIDSFKGSVSSKEAGEAAAQGIKNIFPACKVVVLPVADGGEGTLYNLFPYLHGEYVGIEVHGPLMCPLHAQYAIFNQGRTAFIEMALACGLPLLSPSQRNPMLTTTFGLGELIRDALDKGCREFIIGIGGSATNDAGVGMLQALGYRFLSHGKEIRAIGGQTLSEITDIDTSHIHSGLKTSRFLIGSDVQNPFYGPQGAAFVFAGQKGADSEMILTLDQGLRSFAKVICSVTGKDISQVPGAGAAGGIGGCFIAFLNAELQKGSRLFLDMLDFGHHLTNADLIITGEGRADHQTVMGKTAYGILDIAKQQGIPVILIGGSISDSNTLNKAGFHAVFPILPEPVSLEEAMQPAFTCQNITRTLSQICRLLKLRGISSE